MGAGACGAATTVHPLGRDEPEEECFAAADAHPLGALAAVVVVALGLIEHGLVEAGGAPPQDDCARGHALTVPRALDTTRQDAPPAPGKVDKAPEAGP